VVPATPIAPVAHGTALPPPPKPQPPVRAPIVAAPVQPAAPVEDTPAPAAKLSTRAEQPTRSTPRGQVLSDSYVEALLADDALPETWGFDASPGERKTLRRHKVLTTAGILLGFASVAELIDFVMSHLH